MTEIVCSGKISDLKTESLPFNIVKTWCYKNRSFTCSCTLYNNIPFIILLEQGMSMQYLILYEWDNTIGEPYFVNNNVLLGNRTNTLYPMWGEVIILRIYEKIHKFYSENIIHTAMIGMGFSSNLTIEDTQSISSYIFENILDHIH